MTWHYRPSPDVFPLPCELCAKAPGTVAIYHGLVRVQTLCPACAREHRALYGEQLPLCAED